MEFYVGFQLWLILFFNNYHLEAFSFEDKYKENSFHRRKALIPNVKNPIDISYLEDYLHDEDNGIYGVTSKLRECPLGTTEPIDANPCFDKWLLSHNLYPYIKEELENVKFYLFKRGFRDCGQRIGHADCSLLTQNINKAIPTRILVHGWMTGSFSRDIKNAYIKKGDYNVIICDWSDHDDKISYDYIMRLIETVGSRLANFTRKLHEEAGINYNDIYIIGHSVGAQIAGVAGQYLKPHQYNTIFALDPAAPGIRSSIIRINSDAARYVETIQTNRLGFTKSNVNATFYPNYSFKQKDYLIRDLPQVRSYKLFAESINSRVRFSGIRCTRGERNNWECDRDKVYGEYLMGGEPSITKSGIFYVETNADSPYAMG
uniref:Lipase domain-containing protein n=1 Tax=Glossina brevipalpis TaxID=37001 RepID=A0A1A9WEZ5_9MUSC